jgi:microcystin-dependent protein
MPAVGFLIPKPVTQFDDADGFPLAGGWFYSYEAGSDTPLAIYTDEQCTTPHTNPAELDASGEIVYYIPQGVAYKFNLTDADDVQQANYPVDNISVPDATPVVPPSPVPTGGIMAYGGTSAPTGFLICDGSAVSRTTYAALFAVIGSTFGGGDGSTTFEIPDMRGRAPYGKASSGTAGTLGGEFGALDHTHTGPSHTHTATVPRDGYSSILNTPQVGGRLMTGNAAAGGEDADGYQATSDVAITTAAGGTEASGTSNGPALVVHFIIKT